MVLISQKYGDYWQKMHRVLRGNLINVSSGKCASWSRATGERNKFYFKLWQCDVFRELMHLAARNKSKYNNVDNVMMLRVYLLTQLYDYYCNINIASHAGSIHTIHSFCEREKRRGGDVMRVWAPVRADMAQSILATHNNKGVSGANFFFPIICFCVNRNLAKYFLFLIFLADRCWPENGD